MSIANEYVGWLFGECCLQENRAKQMVPDQGTLLCLGEKFESSIQDIDSVDISWILDEDDNDH